MSSGYTCTQCKGTGKRSGGFFMCKSHSDNKFYACPHCKGKGVVFSK